MAGQIHKIETFVRVEDEARLREAAEKAVVKVRYADGRKTVEEYRRERAEEADPVLLDVWMVHGDMPMRFDKAGVEHLVDMIQVASDGKRGLMAAYRGAYKMWDPSRRHSEDRQVSIKE